MGQSRMNRRFNCKGPRIDQLSKKAFQGSSPPRRWSFPTGRSGRKRSKGIKNKINLNLQEAAVPINADSELTYKHKMKRMEKWTLAVNMKNVSFKKP